MSPRRSEYEEVNAKIVGLRSLISDQAKIAQEAQRLVDLHKKELRLAMAKIEVLKQLIAADEGEFFE